MAKSYIADVVVAHSDLPLTPTIQDVPDVDVQVESQPASRESPRLFYSVIDSDFQSFEAALADDHTVDDWWAPMELDDCRIYQINPSSNAKFTTPKIAELGVRLLSIQSADHGWHFQLQAPDKESLGAYWQYCRDEDVEFHLEKLYSSGPQATPSESRSFKAQLTDRQLEVARTVTRLDYYDPDGSSAEEVAKELGITSSTLSTHLRRIMAKVFNHMFENEQR